MSIGLASNNGSRVFLEVTALSSQVAGLGATVATMGTQEGGTFAILSATP